MATKKKVITKKKAAPTKKVASKKKVAAKKKSVPKQKFNIQDTVREESIVRFEEESAPSPMYTPSSSTDSFEEKSGSPMLKYIIAAGVVLVALIAYSVMKGKTNDTATPEKQQATEATSDSKKLESPAPEVEKEKPTKSEPTQVSGALKGFAVTMMASDKTFAEAVEHCKANSMKVPTADQLRAVVKNETVPAELGNTVVWTSEKLRFLFSSGKALNVSSTEKLSVLCKE
jgi:hypothetical protein